MAADDPTDGVASAAARDPTGRTSTYVIAIAAGATSMSFNVWYPFMPLYALDLGAKSDADAVFWVALAITVQGVSRLASSAIWGVLSDRWGRKLMLLRALYLSSITFAFAAAAQAPWHLAIALGCQGFFSGFVPASVALVSVSVPDSRLNTSLSTVTGIQYLGTTIGPALGALLAVVFGFRGSIIVASLVPLIAATAVLVVVPRDQVARRRPRDGKGPQAALEPFRMSRQFVLAVAALFSIYSMNELIRLVTPIALKAIQGSDNVEGESGLAFTLAGLVSATSVLLIAPRLFRIGRVSRTLGGACAIGACGFLILALTNAVPLYILGFLLVALVVSAMVPALNTLIAANVVRSRRGTGFGVAASVQALSFALGPLGAAFFAAVSLNLGFGLLAFLFFALGLVLFAAAREPRPQVSGAGGPPDRQP